MVNCPPTLTPLRFAVVPEFCFVHVTPSGLVRIVPPSPTATSSGAALETTLRNVCVVPDCCVVHESPSVLVRIVPLAPTAMCLPPPYTAALSCVVTPVVTAVQLTPSVLMNAEPDEPTVTKIPGKVSAANSSPRKSDACSGVPAVQKRPASRGTNEIDG